ncbi:MAG: sulfoxide reductase heme-binding subunit YedZ [Gammaproteobacteria bacterium]|nr:sulfoxide reductase heme-binding subunit YedZ [Gammaproteobacteria bacterium]
MATQRLLKPVAWTLLSLPLAWLGFAIYQEAQLPGSALGADPGEAVLLFLGEWGMRTLLLALSVSTLRRRLGYPPLLRIRRLVGLFAFTYLSLHFLFYLGFFAEFDWRLIFEDISERPYITVGFAALLMLLALAVTSTNGWQRRLRRRWRQLHRLVYPASALGLLHLWWLTKEGYGEVAAYGVWLLLLYLDRLQDAWAKRTSKAGAVPKSSKARRRA